MAAGRHFRFGHKHYHFKFRIGFFLLCLFFFVLFCVLSVWQYQRYHFKKTLVSTYQQRLQAQPESLVDAVHAHKDMQFRQVKVTGQLDNAQTMLIQNRYYKGRMGFEVLTPLQIPGIKKLLLVDRGWIPKEKVSTLSKDLTQTSPELTGYIKLLNEQQFILGKNIYEPNKSPLIMQKIDVVELNHILNKKFFPYIFRLTTSENDGFIRDWTITAVMPERHLGYAIQWLAMALVLAIAYVCFSCERMTHDITK